LVGLDWAFVKGAKATIVGNEEVLKIYEDILRDIA
jgi:hypothetical protein